MSNHWHCQNPSKSAISASTGPSSGGCRHFAYMKHQDGFQEATGMRMMQLFLYNKCVEMKTLSNSILLGLISILALPALSANAESGYQTINGTQVYTVIDHAAGLATFSNSCGSQTLTQGQLQAGAIPNQIIPCPGSSQRQQPPSERCNPGYGLCPDGRCAPLGSTCCRGGYTCSAGLTCGSGRTCMSQGNVAVVMGRVVVQEPHVVEAGVVYHVEMLTVVMATIVLVEIYAQKIFCIPITSASVLRSVILRPRL